MTDADYLIKARTVLGLSQKELAESIGWKAYNNVSLIETGKRPMHSQTKLAVECLLRRENKLKLFK